MCAHSFYDISDCGWLAVASFFVPLKACFTRVGISDEPDCRIYNTVALRWNRSGADFNLKRTAIFSFLGSVALASFRVEYFVVITLNWITLDWLSYTAAGFLIPDLTLTTDHFVVTLSNAGTECGLIVVAFIAWLCWCNTIDR